ncbi:MAG TPA: DUF3892 domain-containing protein [Kofleriaceae bacterium]|jgi:hypothetical protein
MAKHIVKVELSKGGSTVEHIEWVTSVESGTKEREARSEIARRIRNGVEYYTTGGGTRAEVEAYGKDFIRTKGDGTTKDNLLSLV